jgi:hypothetical protein
MDFGLNMVEPQTFITCNSYRKLFQRHDFVVFGMVLRPSLFARMAAYTSNTFLCAPTAGRMPWLSIWPYVMPWVSRVILGPPISFGQGTTDRAQVDVQSGQT